MLDVKARLYKDNKLCGYLLTDRIEDIQVNLEQFDNLVKNGIIYHVRYFERSNEIKGILGVDLEKTNILHLKEKEYNEDIKINHKVVRLKQEYLIKLLEYEFLDYVQIKYFTNRFTILENTNILKDLKALEILNGEYKDGKTVDIQPFIDNYANKYDILGFHITNTSDKTIQFRASNKEPFRKLNIGQSTYINYKEYNYICKKYNVNKNKLLSRDEDAYLSIEQVTENKVVEQLSLSDRKKIIEDKRYKKFKDALARSILREKEYNEYRETGKCW